MSPAKETRPILVTGAHRSGTTWVGKMLALAPGVGYIHEPFNPLTGPGVSSAPFDRFFRYVCDENGARYAPGLERTLAFRYDVAAQARTIRSPREAVRSAKEVLDFTRARLAGARPLVKDPIAVLSAEWLAERFSMDVVVLVRHPAAFASSLKRLGWTHRFEHFLDQPALLERHLRPFEDEIRAHADEPGDLVSQAILLWRIVYATVAGFRARRPEWIFLRHEDLSLDPEGEFERLYDRLGLRSTPAVRARIRASSAASNPEEARSRHGVRVDSRRNVTAWKRRLTPAEIERIRDGVADVAPLFYSRDDW